MEFFIVLKTVAVMMAYLFVGFGAVKAKVAETGHARSISGILIYVCGPCMVINSFLNMTCTKANNISLLQFFFVTLLLQFIFLCIVWLIVKKKMENAQYRILTIGAVLGNVGFFGIPICNALFPTEPIAATYCSVYVMSMNIIVFTVGVFMLTKNSKYMSIKSALVNPTTFGILIALPLYIFSINLPEELTGGIALMGKMTTPMCMFVLGMRLASVDIKALFMRPFAYITSALKLLVFPVFAYTAVRFLPCFDNTFKVCILVLSAAPTAAIVLSMAELHKCQQELSANVVLLSTLLSIITMPLVLLLV